MLHNNDATTHVKCVQTGSTFNIQKKFCLRHNTLIVLSQSSYNNQVETITFLDEVKYFVDEFIMMVKVCLSVAPNGFTVMSLCCNIWLWKHLHTWAAMKPVMCISSPEVPLCLATSLSHSAPPHIFQVTCDMNGHDASPSDITPLLAASHTVTLRVRGHVTWSSHSPRHAGVNTNTLGLCTPPHYSPWDLIYTS